jgi:glycosidase
MWPELKFENEYRNNFQPGKKTYDKIRFDKKQFDFYQKLIQIRKENPVLSSGDFNFTVNEGKKLGYSRSDGENEIIVLFNLEENKVKFDLPGGDFINLLTGKKHNKGSILLKPMKAVILKKMDK